MNVCTFPFDDPMEGDKKVKQFIKNTFVFIKRRVFRTWPAYFFALISYIFFYRYFENELIFYFFFLQNLFYPMVSNTFFSVSWSICVEELFYIIFPTVLCAITIILRTKQIQPKLLIIFTCLIIILVVFDDIFYGFFPP